jgi:uncharacterized repeat protein (TIGR01451 family)
MRVLPLLVLSCTTAAAQTVEVMSRIDPPSPLGTGGAQSVVISGDGHTVFVSSDSAAVLGFPNAGRELRVYEYDMVTGALSVVMRGAHPRAASVDGRVLVLETADPSSGQAVGQVISIDLGTGAVTLVSHAANDAGQPANGQSFAAAASADGRFVLFDSLAGNLVPGQLDPQTTVDVFLFDAATGQNTLVSGTGSQAFSYGSSGTGISPDGRWITFHAAQPPMNQTAQAYLFDRLSGSWRIVSHPTGGTGGTLGLSLNPRVSADGEWVVFDSNAPALVPGLPNPMTRSVFLYETATGVVGLLSYAAGSPLTPGSGVSSRPRISPDGTQIAYTSSATNLAAGQVDTNGGDDVFLFDRLSNTTRLLSRTAGSPSTTANGAAASASLSFSGGHVAFESQATDLVAGQVDANGERDLFAIDVASSEAKLLSHRSGSAWATGDRGVSTGWFGASGSSAVYLSAAGWSAVFLSAAGDLTEPADGNGAPDPFFVHLASPETRRVTPLDPAQIRSTGDANSFVGVGQYTDPPTRSTLSGDGRYAVFVSEAHDLVPGQIDSGFTRDVFLFDQAQGTVSLVSHAGSVASRAVGGDIPAISTDGRWIAFGSASDEVVTGQVDTNNAYDLFLHDRVSGQTALITHVPTSPTTTGDDGSFGPVALARDGSGLAFESRAKDLVTGQVDSRLTTDVFFYEVATGTISLISHVAGSTVQAVAATSGSATVSTDGRLVAFQSVGTNLVPGQVDTPSTWDIFLKDRQTGQTVLASHRPGSGVETANSHSFPAMLSADAGRVAFLSLATDLVPGQADANGALDAFLFERSTGTVTLVSHAAGAPTAAGDGRCEGVSLSASGRYVAYYSEATNLVAGQVDTNGGHDVFLYDALTDMNRLASHAAGSSLTAANAPTPSPSFFVAPPITLSDEGRVPFVSAATDLVPGGQPRVSAYLFDATTDTVKLVSRTPRGEQARGEAWETTVSANGNFVAFSDSAFDIVADDTNRSYDSFLFGPLHLSTNLRVTLADSADPVANSQAFRYALSVANLSSTPATGTMLTVELPAGVAFQGSTPGPPTCVEAGGVVRCDLAKVGPGGSAAVTIDVTAVLPTGVLTCRARVRATEPDVDRTDDVAVETTTVDPADLSVAMTGPAGPVPAGVAYAYTVSVSNQGPASASGVTLVDTLPAGMDFLSSTPGPPTCTHASGVLTCSLGALAAVAGTSVVLQVQPAPHTVLTNAASATATTHDPDLANNAAQVTTAIAPGLGAELNHGTTFVRDLAARPGPTAHSDAFRLARAGRSSWEIVVDQASGDLSGLGAVIALERLSSDGSSVLQTADTVGTGHAVRLSVENATAEGIDEEVIRVRSTGCTLECGSDDTYRISARETTVSIPRFNNSATQLTILLLQNPDPEPRRGHVWFWSATGALLASRSFALEPRGSLVLPTSALPELPGASGSVTVSHDGPYGSLAGKAVALEPGTGFAFDTPLLTRMR